MCLCLCLCSRSVQKLSATDTNNKRKTKTETNLQCFILLTFTRIDKHEHGYWHDAAMITIEVTFFKQTKLHSAQLCAMNKKCTLIATSTTVSTTTTTMTSYRSQYCTVLNIESIKMVVSIPVYLLVFVVSSFWVLILKSMKYKVSRAIYRCWRRRWLHFQLAAIFITATRDFEHKIFKWW